MLRLAKMGHFRGRDWFNPEGLHDPPPPGLLPECALTLVSQPENEVSVTHFIFHSSVTLIKSHVARADGELTDPRKSHVARADRELTDPRKSHVARLHST